MYLQEVLADGACLFRAFVRSLAEVTGQRYTCEDARRICVENIRQSPELFSRYSRFSDLDQAERYLNNMSTPMAMNCVCTLLQAL